MREGWDRGRGLLYVSVMWLLSCKEVGAGGGGPVCRLFAYLSYLRSPGLHNLNQYSIWRTCFLQMKGRLFIKRISHTIFFSSL